MVVRGRRRRRRRSGVELGEATLVRRIAHVPIDIAGESYRIEHPNPPDLKGMSEADRHEAVIRLLNDPESRITRERDEALVAEAGALGRRARDQPVRSQLARWYRQDHPEAARRAVPRAIAKRSRERRRRTARRHSEREEWIIRGNVAGRLVEVVIPPNAQEQLNQRQRAELRRRIGMEEEILSAQTGTGRPSQDLAPVIDIAGVQVYELVRGRRGYERGRLIGRREIARELGRA